jgi:hypothetical protein
VHGKQQQYYYKAIERIIVSGKSVEGWSCGVSPEHGTQVLPSEGGMIVVRVLAHHEVTLRASSGEGLTLCAVLPK